MKHIHTAFALALAATVIAGPAVAQQKITVEVGAPAGYDIKRANRGPSAGWANWCINENKGKPMADPSTCNAKGKNCSGMCIVDGKKIDEPWKATAK